MNIRVDRTGNHAVLLAEGHIDSTNSTEFQQAIGEAVEETDRAIVLDCQDLTYISSAGLRVVLLVSKDLQRQGTKLAICSLQEPVREVFVISGFDRIIPIHESADTALSAIT